MALVIFLLTTLAVTVTCDELDLIFVGGTGDLAKKHIWPSVNHLLLSSHDQIRIFSAGRSSLVTGKSKLRKTLEEISLTNLNAAIQYTQLASANDYNKFCKELNERVENPEIYERIFYISIPPDDYVNVTANVFEFCSPKTGVMKIVIEKPFGSSYEKAETLYKHLLDFKGTTELYLIDHYMWKKTIRQWPVFYAANRDWIHAIWTSKSIKEVEIILYETADVDDRMHFYDSCGVIADVLQSHLTQLLLQMAAINGDPLDHLSRIKTVTPSDIYLAQYNPYPINGSKTPTFASTLIHSSHQNWKGTKFYLKSGKALHTKLSLIGIRLKESLLDLQQPCTDEISYDILLLMTPKPAILLDKRLSVKLSVDCGLGWIQSDNLRVEGVNVCNYLTCIAQDERDDSYEELLNSVLNGDSGKFLSLQMIVESWRLWKLVVFKEDVGVYEKGSKSAELCRQQLQKQVLKEEL